jgi:hypothetical protein
MSPNRHTHTQDQKGRRGEEGIKSDNFTSPGLINMRYEYDFGMDAMKEVEREHIQQHTLPIAPSQNDTIQQSSYNNHHKKLQFTNVTTFFTSAGNSLLSGSVIFMPEPHWNQHDQLLDGPDGSPVDLL